ncbi:MAG: hypothetical protein GVY33_16960 [Alphaproteobacteria bacterium]|nr:hypothetical protein [Alphaproteobacteria bacterium]
MIAWALPLGTLVVGGALAAALVVAPAPLRQRIADVIAPDTAAPPDPTVAGGAPPASEFGPTGRGEAEAAADRPITVETSPSVAAPEASPGEAPRPSGEASPAAGEATGGDASSDPAAVTPALEPSGPERREGPAAALPAAATVGDAAAPDGEVSAASPHGDVSTEPRQDDAGIASTSAADPAGAETAPDTAPSPPASGGGGEPVSRGAEAVASAPTVARPEPPRLAAVTEPERGSDARTVPAAAAGGEPGTAAADQAGPLGPGAADTRVVLHFPPSAAAVAGRAAASLRSAGVGEATTAPARFNVSRTNVRYYRPEYGEVARGVAQLVGRHLAGPPVATRDFTDFRPLPSPGTIEVWLAGSIDAPPSASPPAGATTATADAAERERLEDEVTRMLRSRLQELQQR